jgi:hypothetical protein
VLKFKHRCDGAIDGAGHVFHWLNADLAHERPPAIRLMRVLAMTTTTSMTPMNVT